MEDETQRLSLLIFFSFEKQETIGGSTGPLKAALVAPRRNRQWAVR